MEVLPPSSFCLSVLRLYSKEPCPYSEEVVDSHPLEDALFQHRNQNSDTGPPAAIGTRPLMATGTAAEQGALRLYFPQYQLPVFTHLHLLDFLSQRLCLYV